MVSAIRILEQIAPEGDLLFDAHAHDFLLRRRFTGSITYGTMSERIERFATWASEQAERLERPYETVPADPHGAIGTERFRRPWPGISPAASDLLPTSTTATASPSRRIRHEPRSR